MKFFNISKRKQKGHKKEDPFAQKINTVKASTPLERAANLKVEHLNTRSYSFPKRGRERERERENLLITRTPKKKLAMQKRETHLVETPLPAL